MEKLAILGGKPTVKNAFPLWPVYDEGERTALNEVLDSRIWWRTPGTRTLAFEKEFATYHGAKHGIAITNGTAAIEVGLWALGIRPGDEVIVPDFTFVATASAVLFCGAMPILVDVLPDTYCIDPKKVEKAITKRTKAVIAVHMGGHPADLDALQEICRKNKLFLVEDCSHAHGSEWKGKKIGTFGEFGTFSFQSSKLMTAGEGGIIITNNDEIERLARSVHDCGRLPGQWFYSHYLYGSNYRLSEWQGAVLSQQLKRLDAQAIIRTRNCAFLDKELSEIEGLIPQKQDERCTRNGHYAYIFHYDSIAFKGLTTKKFIEALNKEGVPTQASYPPLHDLDVFCSGEFRSRLSGKQAKRKYKFLHKKFNNTQRAAWETIWLPQYVLLGSAEQLKQVVTAIRKIKEQSELMS